MNRGELYNDLKNISILVECMGDVVRNDVTLSKEELLSWAQGMNELKERIDTAKKNILKYHLEKVDK